MRAPETGGGDVFADADQPILRNTSFVVAMGIAIVVALGFGLVVPVLPLFASSFGVSVFAATFVVSVFAGVRLVSNMYSGQLADRIGTRKAVSYGVLIVAASSLLTAFSPSYWWLVAFRGVGGFGSALFFTALLALVVRIVPATQRGRAVGLLQGAFLFGLTAGPFAGGVLAEPLGLRWPFVIYALTLTVAGAIAFTLLPRVDDPAPAPVPASGGEDALMASADGDVVAPPEQVRVPGPPRGTGMRATWQTAKRLSADPAFVAALVMMAASRWSVTGVRFSLIPLFGEQVVGLGPRPIAFAVGVAAVTQLLVLWPVGKASDILGRRVVGVPAHMVFGVIAVGLAFATTPFTFFVAIALYGAASGLTSVTPPSVVADVVPKEDTGVGVGVLNTAGDIGSVFGPLVSGFLVDVAGYGLGFGIAAAFLFVAAFFALRMRETLPASAA
jgi:MFS family permease